MTVAVFAGFQTLLVLNFEEFQTFAILCMAFVEFQSKFTLFWKFMDFQSCSPSIFYKISNVVHGGGGGGWIFSGIAQSQLINDKIIMMHYTSLINSTPSQQ